MSLFWDFPALSCSCMESLTWREKQQDPRNKYTGITED